MINKLTFDNGTIENFTIILSTRDHRHIGAINNIAQLKCTCNLNSANEISFMVYKTVSDYTESTNGKGQSVASLYYNEPLWDDIFDLRLVYVPELNEYFEIYVSQDDNLSDIKNVTGTSCCEAELSQTNIYSLEINTENDRILNPNEDGVNGRYTQFYNSEDTEASLIHRVLSYVPAYTFDYNGSNMASLSKLVREFSVSDQNVYDFLTGDVAEQFNCMFEFDSVNRKIRAIDLYTVCENSECSYYKEKHMKYRGDFHDFCPKCGGSNLWYYGKDTSIFVSTENLTDQVQLTTDIGSVKNCFKLEAGDEDMTAAVVNINPSGSNRIYEFSDESLEDMPDELVEKLESYDALYKKINEQDAYFIARKQVSVSPEPVKVYETTYWPYSDYQYVNYEYLYNKYKDQFESATKNTLPPNDTCNLREIVGYSKIVEYKYEFMSLYSYLKSSMMPTKTNSEISAKTEAAKLSAANLSPFSMSILSSSTSIQAVNASLINYAKVFVNSGYVKVEVYSGSNSSFVYKGKKTTSDNLEIDYGTWSGYFKITSFSDDKDVYYVGRGTYDKDPNKISSFSIEVNTDYKNFMNEKIKKSIDGYREDGITDILASEKTVDDFISEIKKYSYARLLSIKDACEAVLTILVDGGVTDDKNNEDYLKSLYKDVYVKYKEKALACDIEIRLRAVEISILYYDQSKPNELDDAYRIYINQKDKNTMISYVGSSINDKGILQIIDDIISGIHKKLNFETHLGNLYNTFTTYIREQTYSNSNFVSDASEDKDEVVIERAMMFTERAKEELHKSSRYQHSLSSNLNNLLAIKEFASIVDDFQLGNFIRVGIDNHVYRLRLVSYSIDFENPSALNTEFSDFTETSYGLNDINSILSKASSMASSYGYVSEQANKSNETSSTISEMLATGLNSANTTISNNNNEEVQINESGIVLRTLNFDSGQYDDEQARLTHNMMCYTDDGWRTVKCALGKHTHYKFDNDTKKTSIGYGLTADFVSAGYVTGSQIIGGTIYSGNYSINGTGTKLNLENGTFVINGSDGAKIECLYSESSKKTDLSVKNIDISCTNSSGNKGAVISKDGSFWFGDKENNKYMELKDGTVNFKGIVLSWNDVTNGSGQSLDTVINNITKEGGSIDQAKAAVNKYVDDLVTGGGKTEIGANYVISPYIGGGYLYLSGKDELGIGATITLDPSGNKDSSFKYLINCQHDGSSVFNVDNGGNVYVKGKIDATSLTLSSDSAKKAITDLTDSKYYSKDQPVPSTSVTKTQNSDGTYTVTVKDQNGKDVTSYVVADQGDYLLVDRGTGTETSDHSSNYFKINKSGALVADNALIYGTIYAGAGNIGDWVISDGSSKTAKALKSTGYESTGKWVTLNPSPNEVTDKDTTVWDKSPFTYGRHYGIIKDPENKSSYEWWYPFRLTDDGRTKIDNVEHIYDYKVEINNQYVPQTVQWAGMQTAEFQVGTGDLSTLAKNPNDKSKYSAEHSAVGRFYYNSSEESVYLSSTKKLYIKSSSGTTLNCDSYISNNKKLIFGTTDTPSSTIEKTGYVKNGRIYFDAFKEDKSGACGAKCIYMMNNGIIGVGDANGGNGKPIGSETSDRRLKNSITKLDNNKSANFIYSLSPVKYRFNEDKDNKIYHHGFIAQEVEKASLSDENWKVVRDDETEEGYKTLHYVEIIADLVATVQTLNDRIKALENK